MGKNHLGDASVLKLQVSSDYTLTLPGFHADIMEPAGMAASGGLIDWFFRRFFGLSLNTT
jgi:hypothetical protein